MLQLNKTNHEYTLDGVRVPSVTQIVGSMGLSDFSHVNKDTMDRACDFGDAAHFGSELIDTGKIDWGAVSPGLDEYLQGWVKFRNDFKPAIIQSEKMYFSKRWGFAGTFDRVLGIGKGSILIDIKTSTTVCKAAAKIQTAGYEILYEENEKKKIHQRWVVQLIPNDYRVFDFKEKSDQSVFISQLIVYKYKLKNGYIKTKKEN